jgi:hypothetical protein
VGYSGIRRVVRNPDSLAISDLAAIRRTHECMCPPV